MPKNELSEASRRYTQSVPTVPTRSTYETNLERLVLRTKPEKPGLALSKRRTSSGNILCLVINDVVDEAKEDNK